MSRDAYPIERWRETIAAAYEGLQPMDDAAVRGAVEGTVAALDCGDLRVAEPVPLAARGDESPSGAREGRAGPGSTPAAARGARSPGATGARRGRAAAPGGAGSGATASAAPGDWIVHGWIQQALALYFRLRISKTLECGPLEFHDKIPVKTNLAAAGVRVVPPGVVRYGAYLEPGVIVMPAYVNIGARVGEGTMVDTWATVGSCAQIGKRVHLSGGVGIGGVLEPPQSMPVIVEDDCFVGSRAIVVEGVRLGAGAVLGAGVVLTSSTPIVDVTGSEPVLTRGRVPSRAVVIPGTAPKKFPAGEYGTPCALVIGRRKESTDLKTSLNQALREYGVSV